MIQDVLRGSLWWRMSITVGRQLRLSLNIIEYQIIIIYTSYHIIFIVASYLTAFHGIPRWQSCKARVEATRNHPSPARTSRFSVSYQWVALAVVSWERRWGIGKKNLGLSRGRRLFNLSKWDPKLTLQAMSMKVGGRSTGRVSRIRVGDMSCNGPRILLIFRSSCAFW